MRMGAEEASGHFKLTELFKASRSSSATTANLSLTGELRVSGGEGSPTLYRGPVTIPFTLRQHL